jgi:hypothetical protein
VADAILSPCGLYRYKLTRTWEHGEYAFPPMAFVMLNPSTADAKDDDPTIRRCVGFAKREKCGGIIVVNLYAFRTKDPKVMAAAADPVGPDNDAHIANVIREAKKIVVAWGACGPDTARVDAVLKLIADAGQTPWCLGITAKKQPRHPLMLRSDAALIDFNEAR